jgi:hypothetical protein
MQIQFESSDPIAAQMRDIAERRVKFTMRRISWLIPRALVRLTDRTISPGKDDKCCRIELNSQLAGRVVVTTYASTWRIAIDQSLMRAAKIIRRDLERVRSPLHGRTLVNS